MIAEFNFNGIKTTIQCKPDEKMKDICQKYANKIEIDKNNLYFSYNGKAGKEFNEELMFEEMINSEDKTRNLMTILVFSNELKNNSVITDIIKSKDVICPECKESIKMDIVNYKVILSDCKNNHKFDKILLNEFDDTQKIDRIKIICDICETSNKSNAYNKQFFRCNTCQKKICPLCQSKHDKSHKMINYDDKNYVCETHNEIYNSYCEKCKINLCTMCEGEHKHKKIYFKDIIINKDDLIAQMEEIKKNIVLFNNRAKFIINIVNDVLDKINKYYKIYEDIINNYDDKNKNYEILCNLNKIKYNNINQELDNIIKSESISRRFKSIYNMYVQMNLDEISIIYDNNEKKKEIKIFGEYFVENNKKNCKMIYKGVEYELKEKYNFGIFEKITDQFEIKLKGMTNVINMSSMFSYVTQLSSLPDFSKLNTINVTNMSSMFNQCTSISSLPDISNWNTSNVKYMGFMFHNCSSLLSLPDISNWNTSKVINMVDMFSNCISLSSLPDISKWNTSNTTDMGNLFNSCTALVSLPDISKWDTSNVINMAGIFSNCSSLSSLPDISKWNTSNVTNMENMFNNCSLLSSIPDISKWNTSNVTDMSCMFSCCSSLTSIPDISNWNTSNVTNIEKMFLECNRSLNIPSKFVK